MTDDNQKAFYRTLMRTLNAMTERIWVRQQDPDSPIEPRRANPVAPSSEAFAPPAETHGQLDRLPDDPAVHFHQRSETTDDPHGLKAARHEQSSWEHQLFTSNAQQLDQQRQIMQMQSAHNELVHATYNDIIAKLADDYRRLEALYASVHNNREPLGDVYL